MRYDLSVRADFRTLANADSEHSLIKRTYQPKKRYRRRVHGFLQRMDSKGGQRVIRNRRRKGRHHLTPV